MRPSCRIGFADDRPSRDARLCTQRELEGEVLLTVRKFASSVSVSPYELEYSDDSSDEPDPSVPIDHMTAPLQPIPEPPQITHTTR